MDPDFKIKTSPDRSACMDPGAVADTLAVRSDFLSFHLPDIGEEEITAVVGVLRSGWLTTGPATRAFEAAFARYVGAQHAVAVNSCTAALHLALAGAGIGPGDEVILPTMTFAATAEVVIHLGARPVLIDSKPDDLTMDCASFRKALTPRTKAVIPVHYGGHPCEMDDILSVARDCRLTVIEDAAHALPARYKERSVGAIGDAACFSFYATKTLTTGEGGMITTDSADLADRMRMLSLHGISKHAWRRYMNDGDWHYDILAPGYKYNMPDLAAAIGLVQLAKCDRFRQLRARYAGMYNEAFADIPELIIPHTSQHIEHAWHLYPLRLRLERLRIDRTGFISALKQRNIGSSVHFIPLHLHPYYRDRFGYRSNQFPTASYAYERLVSLPIYTRMSESDVRDVIRAVLDIIRLNRA